MNFKKAYDDKMNKLTPCNSLPQILAPTNADYIFVPNLIAAIIHSHLRMKKIIQLNKFQEETRESLQNLHDEVNRNYEGSFHNMAYHPQGDT
ncbi:hypothetical protein PMALA_036150 [Plasmodium malariae]|uniref:PIR Superfamily Protein n=1 Tax=Plasmodium malariae TaxID=5858 RepID=A0A1A8WHI4_PLAMA|nr:hypothetical protein PMALA_036150 [Plasmodium malariae]